jgi:tungstate transport system ATP-binding protein
VNKEMNFSLILTQVQKSYLGNPILKDCSYAFEEQGIYALIGPNGCGKSTLLRICALLEDPDQGSITYTAGHKPLEVNMDLRRRITLVLPKIGVFNTSVFKNVAYGLSLRGLKRELIQDRVAQALHFVGLGHKKNQSARTLYRGETKRLGLARAQVIEPEILFLDEPTASVDQENTEIIGTILMQLKQTRRTTIIMATHDADQTRRLADRVLRIVDGTLQMAS